MSNHKPARSYSRTGLNALKAKVKLRGLHALDTRTLGARELVEFRAGVIADLGGEDAVTTAELAIVEAATRTRLFINVLDYWLLQQPSLVNAKRRCVLPVVLQRQTLVDSLARLLQQLGLKRRARQIPSLQNYLLQQSAADEKPKASEAAR